MVAPPTPTPVRLARQAGARGGEAVLLLLPRSCPRPADARAALLVPAAGEPTRGGEAVRLPLLRSCPRPAASPRGARAWRRPWPAEPELTTTTLSADLCSHRRPPGGPLLAAMEDLCSRRSGGLVHGMQQGISTG